MDGGVEGWPGSIPHNERKTVMKKLMVVLTAVSFGVVLTVGAADGKAVYAKECTKCHGEDGKGQTKMGQKAGCKDYTVETLDVEKGFKSVKGGMTDKDGKVIKKPFGEKLADDEIKAAVEYLKAFKK